jgi:PIN domain nuclease of toxin-antitoxin system
LRLLLDTHSLLWWLADDAALGNKARALLEDPANDIFVSTVSLWEIVVKARIGKLTADIAEVLKATEAQGFELLNIEAGHLIALAALPAHHRDPFDHLLIAQAVSEHLVFVTQDANASAYPVTIFSCRDI